MNRKAEFKNRTLVHLKSVLALPTALLLLCLASGQATAQNYAILHTFGANVMGLYPRSTLVQGPDGMLYGTTEQGGGANRGQVFKVNPDGTGYTVLKDFTGSDGASPEAGLVLSGTTLYGTAANGGTNDNGMVFELNTDGTGFAVLKQFTGYDGANPYAKLMLSGTVLYGTTAGGGAFWNGTVFKINTDGTGYAVLKHFTGNIDGGWPYADLVMSGTTLYGTGNGGGSYWCGTVFRINTDGSGFTVLKSFNGNSDGGGPAAGLVLSGAILYGTASWGGNSGNGTVFEVNTNGSGFSVLKDFTDSIEGANPSVDLLLSGTTLYGTAPNGGTSGYGTAFKINTDGSGFAVLKDFTNWTDGAYCYAGLLLSGTTLYGTAYNGGNSGYGTVFSVGTDGSGFTVLTNFSGGDGANPYASLTLSGSTFYGTAEYGGGSGNGTVFSVNTNGAGYAVLHSFTELANGTNADGASPNGSVVLSGTTLYGTTISGGNYGYGTAFSVNTDGSGFTVLKAFTGSDGANPYASLVLSGSTLYGTTAFGGSSWYGTVFSVNIDGTGFTTLHSFAGGSDGANLYASLTLSGSTLYGTTAGGGSSWDGTLFSVNIDGTGFTTLYSFAGGNDGANPYANLTLSGSTLYGMTQNGGSYGSGTIFSIDTNGTGFTVLKEFNGNDGTSPNAGLVLSDTTLYGVTIFGGSLGNGTVFQINTDGNEFTVLKHFTGDDGAYPQAPLVLSDSTLYGVTPSGGSLGNGVLFSLSLLPGLPEIQLQPQSQTVQLNSSVAFVAVAGGIPTPAYQWFFNGNAIDGATNYSLALPGIQGSQAGAYTVVVTNSYGSVTSLVATLTVQDPFINNQPSSQYVQAGSTVSFSVDAGGTQPLSFQWFKDGVSLNDDDNISGSQASTLTLNSASGGDSGWYFCVVSNISGSLTSVPAMLVVQDPFINSQPADQLVNAGESAEFSVDAGGTLPLSFQWSKDGVSLSDGGNISGAQTPTLTLTNVASSDAGGYSVVVSNAYGSVASTAAQLAVNLAPADSFDPGADGGVLSMAVQGDGKILVGGDFGTLGGQVRNHIGRLNADGTLDTAFNPGTDGTVQCLAVQPDGKILVGGWFSMLNGQPRSYLGRLNADGTLDTTFDPGADNDVLSIAVQADGKILVGGDFGTLAGQVRNHMGRLNTDGTLDTAFNPGTDGTVQCLAVQPDGKILVGGWFSMLNGQPRSYLGRLNADGTLDTTFDPGADSGNFLVVQADGKTLVGGAFSALGGRTCNHIGRLNTDGTSDNTFNPGADSDVRSLALQADGKIVVGGFFTTLGGQSRNHLGRLNADGTLDTAFNPGTDDTVQCLAVQPDGKILAGGDFGTLAGQSRNHLGRLDNTDPATQDLTFDGSTITWLRGGSSPEIWRTSFSLSTNGTDWLDLGAGTRTSGGWQVTGISAPTNATIRIQGFVTGGLYNGSTWFVETTIGPPAITVQPQNSSSHLGSTTVLSVQAAGSPPLGYQWFKDGISLNDGGNISGSQTPTLVLSNAVGGDAGGYWVVITNASGSITSAVVALTVEDPFINSQPVSQSVNAGATVEFSVDAGGTEPLSYQWTKDGASLSDAGNISGSQTATLTLSSVSGGDTGGYSVIVSNASGTVTSTPAMLVVQDPFINSQPASQTVIPGQSVQLSVAAGGTPPLSYQWLKDGVSLNDGGNISGSQTPTLTLSNVSDGNAGAYSVIISDTYGSTNSAVAVVFVGVPMNMALFNTGVDPSGTPTANNTVGDLHYSLVSVPSGSTSTINVRTSAGGWPIPPWVGDDDLSAWIGPANDSIDDGPEGDYDYRTTFVIAGNPANVSITGQYALDDFLVGIYLNGQFTGIANLSPDTCWFCEWQAFSLSGLTNNLVSGTNTLDFVVRNAGGPTGLRVEMTGMVAAAVSPPVILAQPVSQSISLGADVQFSIEAVGAVPLSYQWQFDGANLTDNGRISGSQSNLLTMMQTSLSDAGAYSVIVSNSYGSVTSVVATLTVIVEPPFITTQPLSCSTNFGANVCFGVNTGGTPPLSYQWQKDAVSLNDGGNISGSQTATLTLSSVFGGNAGGYSVIVSSPYGSVTSQVASLIVTGDPFIITQPVSQLVAGKGTASFSVVAGGTSPFTYQWLKDGVSLSDGGNISGARTATLTVSGVLGADAGGYSVIVGNAYGSVTSQVATLREFGAVTYWSQWTSATSGVPGTATGTISALGIDIGYSGEVENLVYNYPSWEPVTTFSGGMVTQPPPSSGGIIYLFGGNTEVNTITFSEPVVDPVMAIWSLGGYYPNISFVFQTTNLITIESGGPSSEYGGASITQIGNTIYGTEGNGTIAFHGTFTQISWINPSYEYWFGFTVGVSATVGAPSMQTPPASQTAELGSAVEFTVTASGLPQPAYQWFFNGTNAIDCTNSCLELTDVQFSKSGGYTVVVTNLFGAATSAPAMLDVILPVERRPAPAINLMGDVGASLNVEYADILDSPTNWLPLDTVSLTNPPQYCFDVSVPLPMQRFYRAWQPAPASVLPSLNLHMVPAITLTGNVGESLELDYINQFGPTDAWVTLDTVTLTNISQLYFDVSAIGQPARLYRIVPAP